MNRMNTATVGLAVTPTVLSTFLSHVSTAAVDLGSGGFHQTGEQRGKREKTNNQTTEITDAPSPPHSISTASRFTNGPPHICLTMKDCT